MVSKQQYVVDAFQSALDHYKHKYGEENVTITDSSGRTIHAMRLVEDTELLELTTVTDDDLAVMRCIHYSQFDLTIVTPLTHK